MIYCEDSDKYFEDEDEFLEYHLSNLESDGSIDDLPKHYYECFHEFIRLESAVDIAERIVKDDQMPDARSILEWAAEDFYSMCDDMDVDDKPLICVEYLQSELDLFININTFIWWCLRRFRWYDPKYSLGIKRLDRALKHAERMNQHHKLFYPDYKQKTIVDKYLYDDLRAYYD